MPPPMVVLIHGAWHSTACFHALLDPLKAAGFKGHVPARPSVGENAAKYGLDDDTRMLQEVLTACVEAGEHVFVVMHSSAGFVACPAVEGLSLSQRCKEGKQGGIIGIGMISAFMGPAETFMFEGLEMDTTGFEFVTENTTMPVNPAHAFYNDLSQAETERWVKALRPSGFQGKRELTYPGWRDVPVWYLVCKQDNALPPSLQHGMIEKAREQGADITVEEIDSSHSPFLSKPNETAAWIEKAAKEAMERADKT